MILWWLNDRCKNYRFLPFPTQIIDGGNSFESVALNEIIFYFISLEQIQEASFIGFLFDYGHTHIWLVIPIYIIVEQ